LNPASRSGSRKEPGAAPGRYPGPRCPSLALRPGARGRRRAAQRPDRHGSGWDHRGGQRATRLVW